MKSWKIKLIVFFLAITTFSKANQCIAEQADVDKYRSLNEKIDRIEFRVGVEQGKNNKLLQVKAEQLEKLADKINSDLSEIKEVQNKIEIFSAVAGIIFAISLLFLKGFYRKFNKRIKALEQTAGNSTAARLHLETTPETTKSTERPIKGSNQDDNPEIHTLREKLGSHLLQRDWQKVIDLSETLALIHPEQDNNYNDNIGYAYYQIAQNQQGLKRINSLKKASQTFSRVIKQNPENYEAYNRNANVLAQLATIEREESDKDRLFNEAFENYRKCTDLAPQQFNVYTNWGNTLLDKAIYNKNIDKTDLYDQSIDKYKESLNIEENTEAYYSWGRNLLTQVQQNEPKNESEKASTKALLKEAGSKYNAAIKVDRSFYKAWSELGTCLSYMSLVSEGNDEKITLLTEALDKFKTAYDIRPTTADQDNLDVTRRMLANLVHSIAPEKTKA